jgi:hypothetical protein
MYKRNYASFASKKMSKKRAFVYVFIKFIFLLYAFFCFIINQIIKLDKIVSLVDHEQIVFKLTHLHLRNFYLFAQLVDVSVNVRIRPLEYNFNGKQKLWIESDQKHGDIRYPYRKWQNSKKDPRSPNNKLAIFEYWCFFYLAVEDFYLDFPDSEYFGSTIQTKNSLAIESLKFSLKSVKALML